MRTNDDMKALLSTLTSGMTEEELLLATMQGLIAAEISMRRQSLGLSQKDLADKLGVSQGLVSRWERGETNFNLSTLVRLSSVLGLDMQSPIVPTPPKAYSIKHNNIIQISSVRSWSNGHSSYPVPVYSGAEYERDLQEM